MAKLYLAVRHYQDRKKPSLVLECGNQGLVLATFRNEKMAKAFKKALNCGVAIAFENNDIDSIDDLFKEDQ